MNVRRFGCVCVVLLVSGTYGARCRADEATPFTCKTVSLGIIPEAAVDGSLTFSPDLSHVAYVTGERGHVHVVRDGVDGPDFVDIPAGRLTEAGRPDQLRFSPDSKRLAYVAATSAGRVLVVDGRAGSPYDDIGIGKFVFSRDSRHIAAIVRTKGREFVILDGVEQPPYSTIEDSLPHFSPDSAHLYYTARQGAGDPASDSYVIVLDGKEICNRPYASNLTFSPDRNRYAYVAKKDGNWIVVLDGVESPGWKNIGNSLVFSRDSKHFLYCASGADGDERLVVDGAASEFHGAIREGHYEFDPAGRAICILLSREGNFVMRGRERLGPYGYVFGAPISSPDGAHFAFPIIEKTETGEQRRFILDGKPQEAFDDLPGEMEFSADSTRYIYAARRAKQMLAVVDGKTLAFEAVTHAVFSPTEHHLALVGRNDKKEKLFLDGKAGPAFDVIYGLRFSGDSTRLAYVGHTLGRMVNDREEGGKDALVVDDHTIATADEMAEPVFAPDGRHLLALARTGTQWHILIDGQPTPGFDAFPFQANFVFESEAGFRTVAVREKAYQRVEVLFGGK